MRCRPPTHQTNTTCVLQVRGHTNRVTPCLVRDVRIRTYAYAHEHIQNPVLPHVSHKRRNVDYEKISSLLKTYVVLTDRYSHWLRHSFIFIFFSISNFLSLPAHLVWRCRSDNIQQQSASVFPSGCRAVRKAIKRNTLTVPEEEYCRCPSDSTFKPW